MRPYRGIHGGPAVSLRMPGPYVETGQAAGNELNRSSASSRTWSLGALPLTPALSPRRGRHGISLDQGSSVGLASDCPRFPLSRRERAGVRGNAPAPTPAHLDSTAQEF